MLREYTIPQLAGTAAGTSSPMTQPINGEIMGLYIANNSGGTLTINTVHAPQVTVATMTAAGTGWYYPRVQVHDAVALAALTHDGTRKLCEPVPVSGYLQCILNAGGTASVTVLARV